MKSDDGLTRPGRDVSADSQGRVALVTGGGAGIGEAICRVLAERHWQVAVTDVDGAAAARVAESIGGIAAELDVTMRPRSLKPRTRRRPEFGPSMPGSANAGVSSMAPFTVTPRGSGTATSTSTPRASSSRAKKLRGGSSLVGLGGVIVNTASMAGKRGAAPFLAHYVASKFAVVGLAQAMAAELGAGRDPCQLCMPRLCGDRDAGA